MNEFPIEYFSHIMNIHNHVVNKNNLLGSRRYNWLMYHDAVTNTGIEIFRPKDVSYYLNFEIFSNEFIFVINSVLPPYPKLIDREQLVWNYKKLIIRNNHDFGLSLASVNYSPYRFGHLESNYNTEPAIITAEYYGSIDSIIEHSAYVSLIS